MTIILGSRQDDKEDQQVEGDIAHRHAGNFGSW
jgi:hypothetical protein